MKMNYAWVGNLRLAAISVICASLLGACGGGGGGDSPSSSAPPPPTGITAPPTIGVAGGTVSDASGASVIVPPGALATATTIRVANDSSGAPALPAELTAAGNMYAITPHGTTFAEPVDIRIPAPGVTLLPNQELKLAKAQPGGEWEVLGESTFSNGVLTARATSFSYFLPVKVTYLLPIAVTPPFAVTIAATCGSQDCNSATSPVNVTLTVTTNNGQLPNNCSASGFPLRIFAGATPNQETARLPVTGAVIDRAITQQNVDIRYFFTARLSCNSSTGNILASTSIRFLPTPFYPKVNVVRVPPQLDVVAGTSATVDAMLDGAASKMVLDQFGRFESFTAPSINNRALVDWQRSDDGGASWRVVAHSYQDEANPLPLGVGLPWRFWSVRHGFIAAAADHNALLRVVACYTPPDVAAPPCVTGPATRLNVLQSSALPALVDSPRPVLVRTGQTASFSATASGAPTPTLQWQTRAANDSGAWINVASGTGATTNNYTTPVLTLAENGRQYRILASNSLGSAASVAVTASVSDNEVAPSITAQPASLAVVAGSEALFAVAARGTEALSYQWRKNGVAITGANNPLLKLPAVSAADGASYAVVVSNAAGTVTSQTALLTVSAGVAPLLAPTIVTQPSAVSVPSGNTATFAVGVDGSGPFAFQWLKDGVAVAGETRAVFTLANVAAKNTGAYAVTVSNSVGSATSQAAGLDVTSSIFTPPPVAPTISTQPAMAIVTVGGSATLAVAASGSGPLSYQWSLDGAMVAGATGPILSLSNISALNTGSYSVTVSNPVGSVTSSVAQVMLLGAPAIAQPVAAVSTIAGNAATFSVTATGDNLRYLWMRDGLAIAGATSSSYTIANPTIADNGAIFRVIVYNGAGIVLSQSVVLTVAALPTFIAQPADASTTAGGAATFSVTAQNAASLRWQRNGIDLVDGTDASGTVIGGTSSSSLTLSSIAASWSGSQFRALATASGGSATVGSNAATLTVTAPVALQWQTAAALRGVDGFSAQSIRVAAGPNGQFIAAWLDIDAADLNELRTSRYTPGAGWSAPVTVVSGTTYAAPYRPQFHAIAMDAAGNAVVVFLVRSGLNLRESLFASSQTATGPWSAPVLLETQEDGRAELPAVAFDGQGVATAVWQQNDTIYFPNSLATRRVVASRLVPGSAWTPPQDIDLGANGNGTSVRIQLKANTAGDVIAAWATSNNVGQYATANIYRAGIGWTGAQILTNPVSGANSVAYDVAINDAGNTVVALDAQAAGVRSVFVARNTAGAGWAAPEPVDQSALEATAPAVAVAADGATTLVWEQSNGSSFRIWAARAPANGSWSTPQLISDGGISAGGAQLGIDTAGNVLAVWTRNPGSANIVVSARLPPGGSWSAITVIESDTNVNSTFVERAFAVSANGQAAAVWVEGFSPNAAPWANLFR